MNNKGFTLTEIIVALILFSIVATPLTVFFTKSTFTLRSADKIFAIRYAESILNDTIEDKNEQYDTEHVFLANDKQYRYVRRIEDGKIKIISIEIFLNKKSLTKLKGYVVGNI